MMTKIHNKPLSHRGMRATWRRAVGEAPACVQACPHEAITIRLVDVAEVSSAERPESHIVPGAFDSSYTKPTTQYVSKSEFRITRSLPTCMPCDWSMRIGL
jgi:Fe-S-cluster-containing dehydrogenase component